MGTDQAKLGKMFPWPGYGVDLLVNPWIVGHWTCEETLEEGLTAHTGHVGPDGVDPPHHHQHQQQEGEEPQSHQRGVMTHWLLASGATI